MSIYMLHFFFLLYTTQSRRRAGMITPFWLVYPKGRKEKGSGDHTDRELSNLILRCNFSRWLHRNVEVLFFISSPLAFLKQLSNSSHSLDWRAFSKIGDNFTSYFLKNRLTSLVIYLSLTLIEATWLLSRVSHDLRILREPLTPLKVESSISSP